MRMPLSRLNQSFKPNPRDELGDYFNQLGVKHTFKNGELHIYKPGADNPERFNFSEHSYGDKFFFVADDTVFQGENLLYKQTGNQYGFGKEAPGTEHVTAAMQFARGIAQGLNSKSSMRSVLHSFAAPLQKMMGRDFDQLSDTEQAKIAGSTVLFSQAERYKQMGLKPKAGTEITRGQDAAFTVYAQYNNLGVNDSTTKSKIRGGSLSSRIAYQLDYITGKSGYTQGQDPNHIGVYTDKSTTQLYDDRVKQAKRVRSVREEYQIRSLNNKPTAGYDNGVMTMASVDMAGVGAGKAVVSSSLFRNAYGMGQIRRQGIDLPGAADLTRWTRQFDSQVADESQNELAFWGNQGVKLGSFGDESVSLEKSGYQGRMVKRNSLGLTLGYDSATREMLNRALPHMKGVIDQTFSTYDIDPRGHELRQNIMAEVEKMTGLPTSFGGSTAGSSQLQFESAALVRMRAAKETGGFKVSDAYNEGLSNALERDNIARAVSLDDAKTRDRGSLLHGLLQTTDQRFAPAKQVYQSSFAASGDRESSLNAALQHMEGEDFRRSFVSNLDDYGGKLPYFFPMAGMDMTVEYGSKKQMMMNGDHLDAIASSQPGLANEIMDRQVAKGQPYMEMYAAMQGMKAPALKMPEGGIQTDWSPHMGAEQTVERLRAIAGQIGSGPFDMGGVSMPGVGAMERFAAAPGLIGPYMNALTGKGDASQFIDRAKTEFSDSIEFRKQMAGVDSLPGTFGRYTSGEHTSDVTYYGPDELTEIASQLKTTPGKLLKRQQEGEDLIAVEDRAPSLGGRAKYSKYLFDKDVRGYRVNKQFNTIYQGDEDGDPVENHFLAYGDENGDIQPMMKAKDAYDDFVAGGGSSAMAVQRLAAIGGEGDFAAHLGKLQAAHPDLSGGDLDNAILFGHGDVGAYAPMIPGTKNSANPYSDAAQSRSEKYEGGLMGTFGVGVTQLNKNVLSKGLVEFGEKKKSMGVYSLLKALNGNMNIDEEAYARAFPNHGATLRKMYGKNAPSALSQDKERANMVYQTALDNGKLSPKLMEAYGRFNFEKGADGVGSLAFSLAKGMQDTAQFTPEYIAGATVAPGDDYESRLSSRADEITNGSNYSVDANSPLFQSSAAAIYHNLQSSGKGSDADYERLANMAGMQALDVSAIAKRKNVPLGEYGSSALGMGTLGKVFSGIKEKLGLGAIPDLPVAHAQQSRPAAPSGPAPEYSEADMPDADIFATANGPASGGAGKGGNGGGGAPPAPPMDEGPEGGDWEFKGMDEPVGSLDAGGTYSRSNDSKIRGLQYQPGAKAMASFIGKMRAGNVSASQLVSSDPEAAQHYREMGRNERSFVDKYDQFKGGSLAPAAARSLEASARMHAYGRQDDIAEGDKDQLRGAFDEIRGGSGENAMTSSAKSAMGELDSLSKSLSGEHGKGKLGDVIEAVKGSMERLANVTAKYADNMEETIGSVGDAKEAFDEIGDARKSLGKNLGAFARASSGLGGADQQTMAKSIIREGNRMTGVADSSLTREGSVGGFVAGKFGNDAYEDVSGRSSKSARGLLNAYLGFQVLRTARYTLTPLEQAAAGYDQANQQGNAMLAQGGRGINYGLTPSGQAQTLASNFSYNFGRNASYLGGGLGVIGRTGLGSLAIGGAEALGSLALPGIGTAMAAASIGTSLGTGTALGGFLARAAPAIGLATAAGVGLVSTIGAASDAQAQGRIAAQMGMNSRGQQVRSLTAPNASWGQKLDDSFNSAVGAMGKDFFASMGFAGNLYTGAKPEVAASIDNYNAVRGRAMSGEADLGKMTPGQINAMVDYSTFDNDSFYSKQDTLLGLDKTTGRKITSLTAMRSGKGMMNKALRTRIAEGEASGEDSSSLLSAADDLALQLGESDVMSGNSYVMNDSLVGINQKRRNLGGLGPGFANSRFLGATTTQGINDAVNDLASTKDLTGTQFKYSNRNDAASMLSGLGIQDASLDPKSKAFADEATKWKMGAGEFAGILQSSANRLGSFGPTAFMNMAGGSVNPFQQTQRNANFAGLGGFQGQGMAKAYGYGGAFNAMVAGPAMSPQAMSGMQDLAGGDPYYMSRVGQLQAAFGASGGGGSITPLMNPNTGFGIFQRDMYGLNGQNRMPTSPEIKSWAQSTWARNSTGSSAMGNWGTKGAGADRVVNALSGSTFGIGGMAGASLLMGQYQYEGAAAAAGAQIAQLTANHKYAVNVEQPYKLTQLQMGRASDFGGVVQSDFMKSHGIAPVDFGRGRFAREWASIGLQEADMQAGLAQTQTRIGWQMQDLGRAQSQSRTRFQWQREDMDMGRQKTMLNRGMQDISNRYQMAEFGYQRQEFNINRQAYREDYRFNRQVTGLQQGWQMEDFATNIRRATGFDRKQLIKERDRATQMNNLERGQSEKVNDRQEEAFKRQEESMKRQEEYFKKQVDHTKQMNKLEDQEYSRSKKRIDEEQKWSEEDFGIKMGRAAQELAWAEESAKRAQAQMDLKKEGLKVEEDSAKANHDLEMARFEEEKKHELEMFGLAVAAAGAGLAAMKKQQELNELIGKMQEEIEKGQTDSFKAAKDVNWAQMRDAFLAAWKLANGTSGGDTTNPSDKTNKTRASGGSVQAGQSYLVGETSPELFVPKESGKIVPLPDFARAKPTAAPAASAVEEKPVQVILMLDSAVLAQKIIKVGGRDVYLNDARSW